MQDDKRIVTSVLSQAFPTTLLKSTLAGLLGIPVMAIELSDSEWVQMLISPLQSEMHIPTLLSILMLLAVSSFAIFQFALICKHNIKHVVMIHISNEHNMLSFKWLIANLRGTHYIAILMILTICFYCGYYIGNT